MDAKWKHAAISVLYMFAVITSLPSLSLANIVLPIERASRSNVRPGLGGNPPAFDQQTWSDIGTGSAFNRWHYIALKKEKED